MAMFDDAKIEEFMKEHWYTWKFEIPGTREG